MHPYKLSVTNIDAEFGFGPESSNSWSTYLESDQELVVFLNRAAIATSTSGGADYPEIEISVDQRRAVVTVIDGHLYYTELDAHKHNLKVIAEDVVKLLKGASFEPSSDDEAEEPNEQLHYTHRRSGESLRLFVWCVLLGIIGSCAVIIWSEIRYQPRLVEAPKFVETSAGYTDKIQNLAGVYVNELREGGMIFEIRSDGGFNIYELWESDSKSGFMRMPVESHELKIGRQGDQIAYLAGEIHLIMPRKDGALVLHGLVFHPFDGKARDLGPVRRLTD